MSFLGSHNCCQFRPGFPLTFLDVRLAVARWLIESPVRQGSMIDSDLGDRRSAQQNHVE